MFDQNQKALGKPTSEQLKTAEVMKDAWNAPNSPFAGMPFDPSVLNLQGNVNEFVQAHDQAQSTLACECSGAGSVSLLIQSIMPVMLFYPQYSEILFVGGTIVVRALGWEVEATYLTTMYSSCDIQHRLYSTRRSRNSLCFVADALTCCLPCFTELFSFDSVSPRSNSAAAAKQHGSFI